MIDLPIPQKNDRSAELEKLLQEKFEGKLDPGKETRLNWLTNLFSTKELTEVTKRVCYEMFKQSSLRLTRKQSKRQAAAEHCRP